MIVATTPMVPAFGRLLNDCNAHRISNTADRLREIAMVPYKGSLLVNPLVA